MKFQLIDRIESWEPMRTLRARKATSVYEDYWQPSAAGPVLPAGIVLEALCQAGAWLVLLSSEHRKRAALLNIAEVSVLRDAGRGAVLQLEVEVTQAGSRTASVDGTVRVDGEPILVARRIMCAFVDADRFDDPAETARTAGVLLGAGPLDAPVRSAS
ncbi:hypothetical protein [Nocardia sp. NPDC057227]|uniref:hypothetical protein n=1 Tax=Nocardia sp. NPDC057227 TaxID=3346056 RepID=UPI003639EF40